ncbi:MAG: dihydroorotase [Alistipes sp.]|nr:dihydroorotase [Alistipes sp.]
MRQLLIEGGTLINEGVVQRGYILVENDRIVTVGAGDYPHAQDFQGETLHAEGLWIMPGVIDDQVHFREPGLTYKADLHTESMAAAAGGVTSFMDMPNVVPPTTTLERLAERFQRASESSVVNYSFYFGATNDNIDQIRQVDPQRVCGVKLFMGSSTGNMLVDNEQTLAAIFAESPVLVATHCEEESIIRANMARFRAEYGENLTAVHHPLIRSAEACYRSTAKAVELVTRYQGNLHVLHLSTEQELSLFESRPLREKRITNEVCVHHLWFSDQDYPREGNRIKWNPAIKRLEDRDALRQGLLNGKVDVVATDHAPHTLEEKQRPYLTAPSGGPLIQHSLPVMLELCREGLFPLTTVVEKMCHAPAVRFQLRDRGFLRKGYFADLVMIRPNDPWIVTPESLRYKCGWSPFEGVEFHHRVWRTMVNGHTVYRDGAVDADYRGMALTFNR